MLMNGGTYDDEDEEKLRLLRAAADIPKNDIKDINSDTVK